ASDEGGRPLADEPVAGGDHRAAIAAIHAWLGRHSGGEAGFAAVGHRVVHGGGGFAAATLIDDRVLAALEALPPPPGCRRSPASTPRFTGPSRRWRSISRCRGR